MNANQVIDAMGGRREVMRITGLSKGRISQWVRENHIPTSWLVAFRAIKPEAFPGEISGVAASDDAAETAVAEGA